MHYLLDTHSLLWVFNGDKRLSNIARNIIEDRQHTKFVSIVSAWEVGIKISIGKLTFPENTIGFVKEVQNMVLYCCLLTPVIFTQLNLCPLFIVILLTVC